jgi:cell division protein FtsB
MNTNQDLISIHHKIEQLKQEIDQLQGKKQMLIADIKKDNPTFDESLPDQQQIETQINTNLKVLNTKLDSFQKA